MLVAFFVLLLAGIPVGLTLATTGFRVRLARLRHAGCSICLPHRIFGVVTNYTLLAIPLFVFMGVMLEKSKLAEELMDVIGLAAGSLRGGLGIGIILVGVLMGATTGIVGATVVTLGLLTLPGMLRRGYDRGLACGIICASGTLGQIIPPSSDFDPACRHHQPVGRHAVCGRDDPGPAAVAASISCYIALIGIVPSRDGAGDPAGGTRGDLRSPARRQGGARRGPADRAGGRRAGLDHRRRRRAHRRPPPWVRSARSWWPRSAGRLSFQVLRETVPVRPRDHRHGDVHPDLRAGVLARLPRPARARTRCRTLFDFLPGRHDADIWFLMLLIFVLGFFIEWIEISYIAVPLFLPIFINANTDLVWLATLICVNLADLVPHPAIRLVAVFPSRCGAAGSNDARYLPRHSSFCRDAAHGAGNRLRLSRPGHLASQGDRLVAAPPSGHQMNR